MSSTPPIKGILFDMDDTLLDWSGFNDDWPSMERRHLQQVYHYLEQEGCPLPVGLDEFCIAYRDHVVESWSQARTTLRAPHMAKIMQTTLESFDYTFHEGLTIEDCLKAYGWKGASGVEVFPDVPQVLQKLVDMGIQIGILTNAMQPMWVRDVELEHYDLLRYFPDAEKRMSAADLGYLKPHREVFQQAITRMGTAKEETIYVGDNPVADVAGSQGAGLRGVLRVNHPAPPLLSGLIIPDAAINSLDELLPLIEDWDRFALPPD